MNATDVPDRSAAAPADGTPLRHPNDDVEAGSPQSLGWTPDCPFCKEAEDRHVDGEVVSCRAERGCRVHTVRRLEGGGSVQTAWILVDEWWPRAVHQ